jgi:RHS repeat-associated protein
LIAAVNSSGTNYYHKDRLSVRVATNSSGSKAGEQGHYPAGEPWYAANATTKYQFTTYERDAETSNGGGAVNDYAMARQHANSLGRFTSPDPISGDVRVPQSLNRYTYTRNDPINLVDPLGLFLPALPEACFTKLQKPGSDASASDPSGPEDNNNEVDRDQDPDCGQSPSPFIDEWWLISMNGQGTGSPFGVAGGDGGGGGGSLTAQFRQLLLKALKNIAQQCQNVLPMNTLQNAASSLNFYDSRTVDSPDAHLKASDISPGATDKMLYQIATPADASRYAVGAITLPTGGPDAQSLHPSNNVVIGSLWNGLSGQTQGVVLTHEDFLYAMQVSDSGLWNYALAHGAAPNPSVPPDQNFNNWVLAGCPNQTGK